LTALGVGVTDVAKLAAAIQANLLLRDHIKLKFLGADFGPPVESLVSVLISAALVLLLSSLLFARPTLRVVWRRDNERVTEPGPELAVRFRDADGPTLCDIQVSYKQRSLFARFITSRLRKYNPSLLLDMEHENAIKLSLERQGETATGVKVKRKSVTFPVTAANLGNSTASWAMVGVKPARVPADLTVKCGYSLQGASRWLRFWRLGLRIDANVREVRLVRIT